MSFRVTATAEALSRKRNLASNLILEIDGVTTLYSVITTYKTFKLDDGNYFDDGNRFDSLIVDPLIHPLMSMGGTDTSIKQQIMQDKGSASSVSSFSVELIDKNNEISELVSPGFIVDEMLGRKCIIYLNFNGGAHPRDSMIIHRGIVSDIKPQAASVSITVAHPEMQKRQKIFLKFSTKLDGAITNSDTTITLDSTAGFILPTANHITSCVKIGDEIIKFTGISGNDLTGCTRGYEGTTAVAHSDNDDVDSFYILEGNGVDLALKLMLSQADTYWAENIDITHIGNKYGTTTDLTMLYFDGYSVMDKYGITIGDDVTITGSLSNNVTKTVVDVGYDDAGSWLIFDYAFTEETNTDGVCKFQSQYNVLTEGMGMTPEDVDVEAHQDIETKYSTSLPDYKFYLDDDITGKDFIAEQIYFPAGMYSLPRKSKASCGITLPPVNTIGVKTFDHNNITNLAKVKTLRSISKNFYNSVIYKYDKNIEGKYLKGLITYSGNSQSRVKNVGNKPLTIESAGLRQGTGTDAVLATNAARMIDRFQYGTETITSVEVMFKDGYLVECGDIVIFGSNEMKVTELTAGNRTFVPKLYEVVNKSIDLKTGSIMLDLLATGFDSYSRYGSISPSTMVGAGSTSTNIKMVASFGSANLVDERKKWQDFIGETIRIRSADYLNDDLCTFTGFLNTDQSMMVVSGLSFTPSAGDIIEIPEYDTTSALVNAKYKLLFTHLNPTIAVTSGTSGTVFAVGGGDVAKLTVGDQIKLRNSDWSTVSAEVLISDITSNTITVATSLGFTPTSDYSIELIGFIDGGDAYRIL